MGPLERLEPLGPEQRKGNEMVGKEISLVENYSWFCEV